VTSSASLNTTNPNHTLLHTQLIRFIAILLQMQFNCNHCSFRHPPGAAIGRVVDSLRAHGMLDDAIVIVSTGTFPYKPKQA
jgi:hypothetical protein